MDKPIIPALSDLFRPVVFILLSGVISACSASVPINDPVQTLATRITLNWPLLSSVDSTSLLVQKVGRYIAEAITESYPSSSLPQWRFTVIRDQAITAFSIGEGRIYLSDGAVQGCSDEAELAALIAHEMAHQIAGHFQSFDRFHRSTARPTGILNQEITPIKEREADRISISLLKKSGYDPAGALRIARQASNQANTPDERHLHKQRIIYLTHLFKKILDQ